MLDERFKSKMNEKGMKGVYRVDKQGSEEEQEPCTK